VLDQDEPGDAGGQQDRRGEGADHDVPLGPERQQQNDTDQGQQHDGDGLRGLVDHDRGAGIHTGCAGLHEQAHPDHRAADVGGRQQGIDRVADPDGAQGRAEGRNAVRPEQAPPGLGGQEQVRQVSERQKQHAGTQSEQGRANVAEALPGHQQGRDGQSGQETNGGQQFHHVGSGASCHRAASGPMRNGPARAGIAAPARQ